MGHLCFATQCFASGMVGKGGGVAGHLKLKFKLEGSGLEPDWYGASFGLKIFYVRIIIIRDIPVYVRIQVCT
jgi:hypothetical protein